MRSSFFTSRAGPGAQRVWPERAAPNANEWRQANNPMVPGQHDCAGYEAVDVHFAGHAWGGLEWMADLNELMQFFYVWPKNLVSPGILRVLIYDTFVPY